jgi:hypothetical protein
MSKYGEAAVRAVKLFTSGEVDTPEGAWNNATIYYFGENTSSQSKGCPRGAFLGLCEEGLIKGIPRGTYCNSIMNKRYAVSAVSILKRNPNRQLDSTALWRIVLGGIEKKHNSQMDVVLSLWEHRLIL